MHKQARKAVERQLRPTKAQSRCSEAQEEELLMHLAVREEVLRLAHMCCKLEGGLHQTNWQRTDENAISPSALDLVTTVRGAIAWLSASTIRSQRMDGSCIMTKGYEVSPHAGTAASIVDCIEAIESKRLLVSHTHICSKLAVAELPVSVL